MPDDSQTPETIFDRIRSACARVAIQAGRVRINYDRILSYASSLPAELAAASQLDPNCHYLGRHKDTLSFLLVLDSINFGSGYFPHLRKRPGMSGYFTIASALQDFYLINGPLTADQLAAITPEDCMRIFDQDPADKVIAELMAHFSIALNDLGRYLVNQFKSSFTALLEAAGASAARLVHLLRQMPYFNDIESYGGLEVPFFKRAQIIAADLALAFEGRRWGHFSDLDQMTIFADNLVPHVLRMDGILSYENSLLNRINAQNLIPAGSAEEVEIRACAVHAVELIKSAMRAAGKFVTSWQLDNFLWNRGRQPHYKAVPRHRTRTVYY
ncbi:MAG: queuosine salvage family protein [Desulfobacterales bacterium]